MFRGSAEKVNLVVLNEFGETELPEVDMRLWQVVGLNLLVCFDLAPPVVDAQVNGADVEVYHLVDPHPVHDVHLSLFPDWRWLDQAQPKESVLRVGARVLSDAEELEQLEMEVVPQFDVRVVRESDWVLLFLQG